MPCLFEMVLISTMSPTINFILGKNTLLWGFCIILFAPLRATGKIEVLLTADMNPIPFFPFLKIPSVDLVPSGNKPRTFPSFKISNDV